MLKVKKLHPETVIPSYATEGAACFDISSTDIANIYPKHSAVVGTGLAFEIPQEHVLLIFSRSGHGFKNDVRLANCVGVIDSDYRGELKVKLTNDGEYGFYVSPGDRIAQGMLLPVKQVTFEEVEELSDTSRGDKGFGSTGT